MAEAVTVEGLRELETALKDLPKAAAKAVLRRTLKTAAQPIADEFRSKVHVDEGALRDSIGVGTKLTKRQRSVHRKMFKNDKASVEMFVGAGGLTQAITEEFGTPDVAANPALRPAWDGGKDQVLETIKTELWSEIEKAAARLARKAAKAARG